jgi:hypothetical protein
MNPTLATIRARRAEIAKLRQALDAEEVELEVAERVIARLEAARPTSTGAQPAKSGTGVPATQAELVKAVLRTSADPWFSSSTAIGEEIARTHGVEINPNSLQPLLWNMKKEGIIIRDANNRIALTERVQGGKLLPEHPPHPALER